MNRSSTILQLAAASLSNVLVTGSVIATGGVECLVWNDDALGLCFADTKADPTNLDPDQDRT